MTTPRQVLLSQLSACTDTNGWFVSMKSALAGLSAADAARTAHPGSPTIEQLLGHVTFWNERFLKRWRGEPLPEVSSNDATFDAASADWAAAVQRFAAVMAAWKEEIEAAPEDRLEAKLRPDAPDTWYSTLSHLVLHTAHHLGQVVTLRKVMGAWDPKQGVS